MKENIILWGKNNVSSCSILKVAMSAKKASRSLIIQPGGVVSSPLVYLSANQEKKSIFPLQFEQGFKFTNIYMFFNL